MRIEPKMGSERPNISFEEWEYVVYETNIYSLVTKQLLTSSVIVACYGSASTVATRPCGLAG